MPIFSTSVFQQVWHPRIVLKRMICRVEAIKTGLIDPIFGKGAASILDQGIVSGTSFVTSVVIGRMCSKEQLGYYYLALSVVLFVRGIQEQLVSAPYSVYCHRRKGDDLASYTASAFAHQIVLSAFAVICLLGMVGVLSTGVGPTGLTPTVWVLLGAGPFLLLREHIRQLLFAQFRMISAIAVDATVAAFQLGTLMVLGQLGVLSIPIIYAVMGAACAIATVAWFFGTRPRLRFERVRFFADWCHNWSFAKWALATQLVGCAASYVMPWILMLAHDEAATGAFAASCSLVGLANMFVLGLANYLTPKAAGGFAEGGVNELGRILRKTAALFAVPIGVFCLLTMVAGDQLAVFVYGEEYADIGIVIAVLSLSMLANSMSITAGNGLWAMDRPSANFGADLAALTVTVISAGVLVPSLGVLGAALATLAGGTTDMIVRLIVLTRLMANADVRPQLT